MKIVFRISIFIAIFGGAILCGFVNYLKRKTMFDFQPIGIACMIIGIVALIFEFVEEIINDIKDNRKK